MRRKDELHPWEHLNQLGKNFVLVNRMQVQINLIYHDNTAYIIRASHVSSRQIEVAQDRQEYVE